MNWEKDKIYNLADPEEYLLYLERFKYYVDRCKDKTRKNYD